MAARTRKDSSQCDTGAISSGDQYFAGIKYFDGLPCIPPYTTTELNTLASSATPPPVGALAFNTTTGKIWCYVSGSVGWSIVTMS